MHAAKNGPCRVCLRRGPNELHHLIPRSQQGADTFDNLVPLCHDCHEAVTQRRYLECAELAECLTDAEYAHVVQRLGEGALERLFGVGA